MRFKLEGIMPAIVTPFTRGGKEVDYDVACAWAETLVGKGVHGIFVAGSTGEGLLMSLEERKALAAALVDAVGDRINVVVQTGCLDTLSTIALTRHARDIGAKAAGIYTPSFYAFDDAAIYRHYELVAKAVPDIPILLYNIPRFTGNALSAELIKKLAESLDSVVGMKDSSGDMIHLGRILADAPKNFTVINGADEFSYQAYLTGASGSVAITANVAPELFLSIYEGVNKQDLTHALKNQRKLGKVMHALGHGSMIAAYKEAIRLMGHDVGYVRPPQRELTAKERRII